MKHIGHLFFHFDDFIAQGLNIWPLCPASILQDTYVLLSLWKFLH